LPTIVHNHMMPQRSSAHGVIPCHQGTGARATSTPNACVVDVRAPLPGYCVGVAGVVSAAGCVANKGETTRAGVGWRGLEAGSSCSEAQPHISAALAFGRAAKRGIPGHQSLWSSFLGRRTGDFAPVMAGGGNAADFSVGDGRTRCRYQRNSVRAVAALAIARTLQGRATNWH
jgi:hypothetical protein